MLDRDWPPSTATHAPLTRLACSEHRNATTLATSGTLPKRFIGRSRQMNSAMQLALEHPENHVVLIVCLSHLRDPTDLGLILQPLGELTKNVPEGSVEEQIQKERVAAYSAARQRLTHHIQRAVDGFQISIGNRWKFVLQVASILLGIISVFGVLYFEPNVTIRGNIFDTIVTCLVVGTVAGFAASVIRDVFSILDVVKK